MSIWTKMGVCGGLSPETAEGLRLVSKVFANFNEDLYITSIRDGAHSAGSYHYSGRAFDIRVPSFPVDRLRIKLGPDFDVVDEGTHIHIEYDPK